MKDTIQQKPSDKTKAVKSGGRAGEKDGHGALGKGFAILQCFTSATPELGSSEMARMTGIPQSTVWRLCSSLIQMGFLVSLPGRQTMRPGIPCLGLGHAVLATLPIGELALPEMQSMASRHEGAVSLGARDGLNMIFLQRCQGASVIVADLRVGSRISMSTSATGWAYLAALAAAERNKLVAELSASLGKQWSVVEPKLAAAMREFDKHGYVISKGSSNARINGVAVPVKSPDGSAILSLSAAGIGEIFTPEKLARVGTELKGLAMKLGPLLTS
jgi:DNA-binding IclR family transcriptional regulator